MKQTLRVLMHSPTNATDGVSFYRFWGPMYELQKEGIVHCTQMAEDLRAVNFWSWFCSVDVAFMIRPHRPEDLYFVEQCKQWSVPLWIDVDDLQTELEPNNPAYKFFMSDTSKKVFEECIKRADIVSVTTQFLKDHCLKLGAKDVRILPNAIHDKHLKFQKPWSRNDIVMWRGSEHHVDDFADHIEVLALLIKEFPHRRFFFFGYNPIWLTSQFKNTKFIPICNISEYIQGLCLMNASVHMVPLKYSNFNLAKSNLAWLEATLAGSVVVAPDWNEWENARTYRKNQFFAAMYDTLNASNEYLENLYNQSYSKLIRLSETNRLRCQILLNLMGEDANATDETKII